MNIERQEVDRLQFAFKCLSRERLPSAAAHSETCCQASQIWQAADGELSVQERRRIIDHLAQCPLCAESWQLAREMQLERGSLLGGSRPNWLRHAAGWATAAAILLAAGLYVINPFESPHPSRMRGKEQSALQFSVSEDEPLRREDCQLRWTLEDAGPGARYDVDVRTLDLEPLDSARNLTVPQYTIPPHRLSALPGGTTLLWQITATYEDGRRVSRQFVGRLE